MRERIDTKMDEMERDLFIRDYNKLRKLDPSHDMLSAVTISGPTIFAEEKFFEKYGGIPLNNAVIRYFVALKIANGSF